MIIQWKWQIEFKGLYVIECLKNYGWMVITLYRRKWPKPSPRKRNITKQHSCPGRPYKYIAEKGEVKSKGERKRYTQLNADFQRIARRDKKAFLSEQCKEIEENNRRGKTRDLFKKIRATKGTFHGHSKGQKHYGPNKQKRLRSSGKNTEKIKCEYLLKLKLCLSCDLAISLLGMYTTEGVHIYI